MTTRKYLTPLVGNSFRLAGSSVLPVLGAGTPLILEPEPDNKYDPDAVRVVVDIRDIDNPYVTAETQEGTICLGYVPRKSNPKTNTMGVSNKEVLAIISQPNWSASLTFSAAGDPLVAIEVDEESN